MVTCYLTRLPRQAEESFKQLVVGYVDIFMQKNKVVPLLCIIHKSYQKKNYGAKII